MIMPKIPRKTPVKETATVNTAACVNCGTLLTDDQKYVSEGRSYCATCAILPKKQEPALAAPAGMLKWLCYLVAFFIPAGRVCARALSFFCKRMMKAGALAGTVL